MNWEAIGAIGEILAAGGVIATLVYLAAQVRNSAQVSKAQTFQAIFDGVANHNNEMFSAMDVDLVMKGFRSFADPNPAEKARFSNLLGNLFNYLEMSIDAGSQNLLGEVKRNVPP